MVYVKEVASLREGEWSCYGGCYFNGRKNGHLNSGRMVTLQRWSHKWRENGHVTEVVFNAGRMVMLQRKSV